MHNDYSDVRPSPIAGSWYSADPTKLCMSIEKILSDAALPDITGEIIALIVPHAGHVYSGLTAAHAFKLVENKTYERVIVVSPSHQYYHQPILTSGHQAYKTPLGVIPIDQAGVEVVNQGLMKIADTKLAQVRHDQEHSIEIELPFLQVALTKPFSLVPIMLRDQSAPLAQVLGLALANLAKAGSTLLIASTDLSHFYTESVANRLDKSILGALEAFSLRKLYNLASSGEGQACGLGAMAAVMWAALELGADKITVVDYRTSAYVTHDKSSVVGYGAAVIMKTT